jgi:hypothetical protein
VRDGDRRDVANVEPSALYTPRAAPVEGELAAEATWMWRAGGRLQRLRFASALTRNVAAADVVVARIERVLELMRQHGHDVPFIAHYRKEVWQPELTVPMLWAIVDEDVKWYRMMNQRERLGEVVLEAAAYAQEVVEMSLQASDDEADNNDADDDDQIAPEVCRTIQSTLFLLLLLTLVSCCCCLGTRVAQTSGGGATQHNASVGSERIYGGGSMRAAAGRRVLATTRVDCARARRYCSFLSTFKVSSCFVARSGTYVLQNAYSIAHILIIHT